MADIYVSEGQAIGSSIIGGDKMHVFTGGIASNTTIANGGMMRLSGGLADTTDVLSSGIQVVENGTASNTTVGLGGYVTIYGGSVVDLVENGGVVNSLGGSVLFASHTFSGLEIGSGVSTTVHSCTIADGNTVAGGTLSIFDGGVANNTILNTGAITLSGGQASNTTVNGGYFRVYGGVAEATTLVAGQMHVSATGVASSTTVTGGNLYVLGGGQTESTTVNAGANAIVSSGGVANKTTVNEGGKQHVLAGGVANETTAKGESTSSGAKLYVAEGGVINSATIDEYGSAFVYLGGTANNTEVKTGGWLYLANLKYDSNDSGTEAPRASSTIVNGGLFLIQSNGYAEDTIVSAGSVIVSTGATAKNLTLLQGGSAAVAVGANLIGLNVSSNTFAFNSGVVASDTIVNDGGVVNVKSGSTVSGLTVVNGGSATVSAGASVTDLNLSGGTVTLNGGVSGGTIGGTVNLATDVLLDDVKFAAGANVIYGPFNVLEVSNTDPDAEGFSGNLDFSCDGTRCYMTGDGDLFLNGNTVSTLYVRLSLANDGNLYVGKAFGGEDDGEYNVGGSLVLDQFGTTSELNQVFGGGKVTGDCKATITGNTSVNLKGVSANRVYAGYEVLEASNNTLTVNGSSTLTIQNGTFAYIRGGVLKNADGANATGTVGMNVTGDTTTTLVGGTVDSLVGDYQVGDGASFLRTGNTIVSVEKNASVGGTVAGAGVSFGGQYTLNGNSTVSISGGSIKGKGIFGGVTVGSTSGAVADSRACTIDGDVDISIDCTVNDVYIGDDSNAVTSIFVGSYGKGSVTGKGMLLLQGSSSKLHLLGDVVEFIGDSSLASNVTTYVDGESSLVFNGFTCGTTALNVQNIAAFNSIEFQNGSDVYITNLTSTKLDQVSTWEFNAVDGKTIFKVDSVIDGFVNNFNGDKIDLKFEDTLTTCTLMDVEANKGWFNGFENAIVTFNGGSALQWDSTTRAFSDGDFSLSVVNDKSLVLSKLA